jgi:hypothetical protein
MFLLLPQHFHFKLLYQCGCYINITGQKPVSRENGDMYMILSVLYGEVQVDERRGAPLRVNFFWNSDLKGP